MNLTDEDKKQLVGLLAGEAAKAKHVLNCNWALNIHDYDKFILKEIDTYKRIADKFNMHEHYDYVFNEILRLEIEKDKRNVD